MKREIDETKPLCPATVKGPDSFYKSLVSKWFLWFFVCLFVFKESQVEAGVVREFFTNNVGLELHSKDGQELFMLRQ